MEFVMESFSENRSDSLNSDEDDNIRYRYINKYKYINGKFLLVEKCEFLVEVEK